MLIEACLTNTDCNNVSALYSWYQCLWEDRYRLSHEVMNTQFANLFLGYTEWQNEMKTTFLKGQLT